MNLKEARESYKKGDINFMELNTVFKKEASAHDKEMFCNTPVYDRPNFIIGTSQEQMDKEWNNIIKP